MQNISVRLIPIHPANLATFEESRTFGHPNCKWTFERLQRPNAIWCVLKFYAHHFSSTLRIFCIKMTTSDGVRGGGWGLRIVSWEKSLSIMCNLNYKFMVSIFCSCYKSKLLVFDFLGTSLNELKFFPDSDTKVHHINIMKGLPNACHNFRTEGF